jgi:parallel beta-helix repeat protein
MKTRSRGSRHLYIILTILLGAIASAVGIGTAAAIVLIRPNHDANSLQVTSPQVASPKVTSPQVASPKVTSPKVTSPQVASPQVASLQLGGPTSASAGDVFTVAVTAQDAQGKTASGYTGTVHFTSSDSQAVLPADYAFTSTDKGVHTFSATLKTAGSQTVTATDSVTASITGRAAVSINAATGTSYYVSRTGSDSNVGTLAAPFRTIKHAVSFLHPGDTLYIRGGTYAESLQDAIPGGASWTSPVTVAAYPDETVILKPTAGTSRVLMFSTSASKYVIVSGLVLDGVNVTNDTVKITRSSGGAANHIRLLNCDIKGGAENNVLISGSSTELVDYNEILNCTIHDNRGVGKLDGSHYHGIYCETSNNLFQGNNVYNNTGYGIHVYRSSGVNPIACSYNVVSHNKCHDNGKHGNTGSAGIGAYVGDGNKVFDNLVWTNPRGIAVDYGASNALIYNNTIYNNSAYGIDIADNGKATGIVVRNNISYQNKVDYSDRGTSTTKDHNLLGVDPIFVNAAAGDFHLQATSRAIGAGIALPAVTTDIDSVARPKEGACDIGAYEFKKR